jgi:septum formation inhibitor-activating ATPase MinD
VEKLREINVPILGVINKSINVAVASGYGQPIKGGMLEAQYKAFTLVVDKWLNKELQFQRYPWINHKGK